MRIPDLTIDQVRQSVDIVEVISAYVPLKKRGKNYVGLCPFHKEKTPSFTVSADKQMFHCFGCAKGGNVFTFLMEIEKVSFVEAVRTLADRVGIPVRQEETESESQSEYERLYAACRFAGLTFHKNLTSVPEGASALAYVRQRGFSDETVRAFGLGYALDSWDAFLSHAVAEGYKIEDLVKSGLVRAREEGGHYDYFRARLIFPIFTPSGRVIAFGARKLKEDDPAGKYINSPETPIYSKSRSLFGLFHSKEAVRSEGKAVLVEGYADLISLFQEGIQHVVASGGTALTADQVQLVKRYAKTLTLLFDADAAGSSATLRGVDVALEHGLDVEVATLPPGQDPDSFVRAEGASALKELLQHPVSFIDFLASRLQARGMFSSPERKAEAVRSIVQTIAKIPDELKRNFFLKEVAERYEIYESVLFRELDRWTGKGGRRMMPVASSGTPAGGVETPAGRAAGASESVATAERDLLKLVLEGGANVLQFVFSNLSLSEIQDARVRRLIDLILERIEESGSFRAGTLIDELTDAGLKSLLTEVALSRYELSRGWQDQRSPVGSPDPFEVARGILLVLKRSRVQREMAENQRLLKEASRRGEDVTHLMQRHQEHIMTIRQLESLFARPGPDTAVTPPEGTA